MEALTPFRQFVLKVHSRCDLACDHCYVYEHADRSWRDRSPVMSTATMEQAAERIAEHAVRHALTRVILVLHGGEPLLAGPERLGELIVALRTPLERVCALDLRVHTNGVRFDSRFGGLLRAHGVKVGVSLDGDRTANDRHRRYANGRGSFDQVVRAVDLLRSDFPDLYAGLLCTIDVANDPLTVYRALLEHRPPALDFLLPHATWDHPPVRPRETAYADWLIAVFDAWYDGGRPVPVRLFDSLISVGRGGRSLTESLGLEPSDLLVIETDGEYEQADSLKTAFHGAPATGMDVFAHAIDEVAAAPGIAARQGGLAALCATCRSCDLVAACGGGLFAHRYRDGSGFANPSVYCPDLMKLIRHVHRRTVPRRRVAHPPHVLPPATLRSLAAGYGGADAIGQLRAGQRTLRRALIAALRRDAGSPAAWALLDRVDADARDALETTLAHPYVRVWALDVLRRPSAARDPANDAHLTAIACVAASRAGLDATVEIPVRDGGVYLPTVGRYPTPGRRTSTVEVRDGVIVVEGATEPQLVRQLSAGDGHGVLLEDLDPFRDRHEWPAAPRLTEEEAERWQDRFGAAWALIDEFFPDYAPGLAAGLSTIVPLADPGDGHSISSAARDAFGAVAIALPEDPAALCLLLLHEFQHVKLGAVLDLISLYDPADQRRYDAPWRADPRPLEGLFQGVYAHIAVIDFWRRRLRSAPCPEAAAEAARQFDHWHSATIRATETLLASRSLTRDGERFAEEMRSTLRSWQTPATPVG